MTQNKKENVWLLAGFFVSLQREKQIKQTT